jgi:MoaA/NifB/PqqE/SkfB family radical SAM enzyme
MRNDPSVLHVLYRGPLESCNYGCAYCPFAKRVDTGARLHADRVALSRFVGWVETTTTHRLGVLFTPWGEALTRRWYRDALIRLSHLPHVERAVIQTNLSVDVHWCGDANPGSLAIRATYHPEWSWRPRFVARVRALHHAGIRVSCGVVGMLRFREEIAALRAELPPDVYLWVNAVKTPQPEPYSEDDVRWFELIDPLFRLELSRHESRGRSCRAGATAICVYGDGTVRRCHFIAEPLGNLYVDDLSSMLRERACSRAACGCAIGYVYLDHLDLRTIYGDGILERVPARSSRGAARVHLPMAASAVDDRRSTSQS